MLALSCHVMERSWSVEFCAPCMCSPEAGLVRPSGHVLLLVVITRCVLNPSKDALCTADAPGCIMASSAVLLYAMLRSAVLCWARLD